MGSHFSLVVTNTTLLSIRLQNQSGSASKSVWQLKKSEKIPTTFVDFWVKLKECTKIVAGLAEFLISIIGGSLKFEANFPPKTLN
jgi:hypothetical protein